jgi:hypothetical protein
MKGLTYMLKKLLASAALVVTLAASPAMAWEVDDMNTLIDETNFLVGNGCTGTLISVEKRLILTNRHCVDQFFSEKNEKDVTEDGTVVESKISVVKDVPVSQRFYDGFREIGVMTWTTEVVASDPKVDLAVLQILSKDIPQTMEAELYDGDMPRRGDTVFVVGNPTGILDATVTKGIISATNREIKIGGQEFRYYQTDAGIYAGNSGGSIYNEDGVLIGVPSAALMGTHLGFVTPYTIIWEFLEKNDITLSDDEEETVE